MKKHQKSASLATRNLPDITEGTGNIYASVVIMSKRARQLAGKLKEELTGKLSNFESPVDNSEEIFENREQIDISKHYEKMPKPTSLATEEYLENKIYFSQLEQEEAEE